MKRKNGEGTWGKKPIGNILYYFYRDSSGHYTYGRTQGQLENKLKEEKQRNELAKSAQDIHTDPKITLGKYVKSFIDNNKTTLQPYTYYNYIHMVDNYLMKKNHLLAHRQLVSITPDIMTNYFAELGKNYSYGTVLSMYKILSPALRAAEDDGLILNNTVRKMKMPKRRFCKDGRDICTPTPEEMKEIEEICLEKNQRGEYKMKNNGLLFVTILHTGMRLGEIIALRWKDVSFENKTIDINKSASFRVENGGTIYDEKEPKSKSGYRVLPIDDTILQILTYLRTNYPKNIDEDHVFLNRDNIHMSKSTLEQSFKVRVANRLNMPNLTPHSLRHAYGSFLASKRVNPKVIAKLMGHSKVEITFDVYVDGYQSEMVEAANLFDKLGE